MNLIYFLSDVTRDPRLQEQFQRHPKQTMEAHGLTPSQQEALVSGSGERLAEALAEELQTGFKLRAFPDPTPWPGNGHLSFEKIEDNTAPRGAVIDTTTFFTVSAAAASPVGSASGSGGESGSRQKLVHPERTIVGQNIRTRRPTGSDPDHALVRATYVIPADAPTGAYSVVTVVREGEDIPLPTGVDAFAVT